MLKFCKYCNAEFLKEEHWYSDRSCCKVRIEENNKLYRERNKEKLRAHYKIFREQNKEKIAGRKSDYYFKNKEKVQKYNKLYREKNKEELKKKKYKYYTSHKKEINEYKKNRYNKDLDYKLKVNLRIQMSRYIQLFNSQKTISAVKELGCSVEEFRLHLESLFHPHPITNISMTWENYGKKGWHLDHIRPLASIKVTDEADLKEVFHYTNYQPSWAEVNLAKNSKWEGKRWTYKDLKEKHVQN